MDQQAGKLLDQLEEDGLMDNTIVFFYSDHGIGLPRGKFTAYDSGLQVPLVIYVPEKFRYQSSPAPDSKVERLVSFVDFAPTILSMAGLSVPSYMQGHVFAGKSTAKPRQYIHAAVDRISGWLTISRVVRDERYLYIRNYNPEFSWNNPETYSDRAPMRQEITRLAAEGKLNAAQMAYAGPRKAAEALFDTETDPHQIHNLARDPESQNTLARMRAELRRWMLDIRDTGFMPEDDLHKVTIEGGSPWELAKDKSKYPLDRILDCAEMVGKPERLKEQAELLDDPVPAVRLWAARGFSSAGKDAVPYLAAVRKALKDSEPAVRVAAARAIANLRDDPEAIETLAQVLLIDTSQPSGVHASRTLDLLGDKARSALPVVKEAKRIRGGDRWDRIILDDILKRFGEE